MEWALLMHRENSVVMLWMACLHDGDWKRLGNVSYLCFIVSDIHTLQYVPVIQRRCTYPQAASQNTLHKTLSSYPPFVFLYHTHRGDARSPCKYKTRYR